MICVQSEEFGYSGVMHSERAWLVRSHPLGAGEEMFRRPTGKSNGMVRVFWRGN